MASTRPIDTPAQTGPGIPDEPLGPGGEAAFEAELEEAREADERERLAETAPFGENPDGFGPTLGGDLGRPNPGRDLGEDEAVEDSDA